MQKLQEVVLYYQAVKETGAADKTDAEKCPGSHGCAD